MVHCIFRHGARTPVYKHSALGGQMEWPLCSIGRGDRFALALDAEPIRIGAADVRPCPVRLGHFSQPNLQPAPDAPAEIVAQWACVLNGGCRAGQLTDLGCEQAFGLGERLRETYGSSILGIGEVWDVRTMSVRSTAVPRCVASAQFALRGLFPAQSTPVPLGMCDFHEDVLFPNHRSSKRLAEILTEAKSSWKTNPSAAAVHLADELCSRLPADASSALGLDQLDFVRCRDVLVSRSTHGLPLPHGLDSLDRIVEQVDAIATEQMLRMLCGGDGGSADLEAEVHRHSLGVFMAQVLEEMEARARGDSEQGLKLYAAHDTTLMPLLMLLGAFNPPHAIWPGFCACLAFELHELEPAPSRSGDEVGVRILFNFEDITARVQGCPPTGPCPLSILRRAVQHCLPITATESATDGPLSADSEDEPALFSLLPGV